MKKKCANFQHGDFQTQEEKWSPEIVDYVHDLILADPQILVSAVKYGDVSQVGSKMFETIFNGNLQAGFIAFSVT